MSILDFLSTKKNNNPFQTKGLSPISKYERLWEYYNNNGLYDRAETTAYMTQTWIEAMKPLRTVVNRLVEFYASKMCPGDITKIGIVSDNDRLVEAIQQVWKWSGFGSQKQVAIRKLALFGDVFLKIASDDTKVFYDLLDPRYVTDFEEDNRGYITEIRIDIPVVEDGQSCTHTEYWTKEEGYFAIWLHKQPVNTPVEQLGDPKEFGYLAEFGIDFVPIVHIKFKDIGESRGASCVQHALDKIDEANREATRLSQLLFRYNKPIWVVGANAQDKNGRPIPPPKVAGTSEDIEVKDNTILYMPGTSTFNSLIPDVNYDSALNVLNAMVAEVEKDLPELKYYTLTDSNLSGKAIKLLLAPAIDKVEEARGAFVEGLIRLNEMALTVGQYLGFFSGLGNYENGDFDHNIQLEDVFTVSLDEKMATLKIMVEAGLPLKSALKKIGFTEEEVAEIMDDKLSETTSNNDALANSLMKLNGA